MRPQYDYGDQVRVLRNLRNDGTFPGEPTGTLLIRRGSTGYVKDVGTFLQDQIIYSVHFLDSDRIVGCREEELQPADAPWTPSRFEFRDLVATRQPLGIEGRVMVQTGEVGEVIRVLRDHPGGVAYHVHFPDRNTLVVPETALTEAESAHADTSDSTASLDTTTDTSPAS
ncbi:nitrogen fixation protein NifZ [Thiocystis violacea]|uniref:nitrogen fixation protein NifZ n=1 Tax=Thiocystis violacea TaxID=13725 RepID=UPI001903C7AE|nr:nitrogen fixation protein NifZ [Thiocystis violacea]MBK1720847.1 nitrogen fixation protein NifZ [Thiocystis violacea]